MTQEAQPPARTTNAKRPKRKKGPHAPRTQEQRRTETITKLLDATRDCLIDIGHARTTVNEICTRAGVSQGGLFRHFPSLDALMAEVGRHVGEQHLASYRRSFELAARKKKPSLEDAARLLRDHCLSRDNQAFYELFVAARTNKVLKRSIVPLAANYYTQIAMLAAELLPDVARDLGTSFMPVLYNIICMFDGEALHRCIAEAPIPLEDRIAMMVKMATVAQRAK